jgi:hypothetical protein
MQHIQAGRICQARESNRLPEEEAERRNMMERKAVFVGQVVLAGGLAVGLAACAPSPGLIEMNPPRPVMRMMGMGDMADALGNVNELLPMPAHQREQLVAKAEAESLARGKELFHDTTLGNSGLACASQRNERSL